MSWMPSSRCSSEIGLPAPSGDSSRTAGTASRPGWRSPLWRSPVGGSLVMGLQHRPWIGTQYAEQRGALLERRERFAHPGILGVTFDVNEEHIVPFAPARRPRLDAAHADAVAGQRLEQPMQRTGRARVADRQQQRGAIRAARAQQLAPQHQEARGVIGAILDLTHQNIEPVDLGGSLTGDGRGALLVAGAARALGIARHRRPLGLRQMLIEPTAALAPPL